MYGPGTSILTSPSQGGGKLPFAAGAKRLGGASGQGVRD